jgi:hypothetical protein
MHDICYLHGFVILEGGGNIIFHGQPMFTGVLNLNGDGLHPLGIPFTLCERQCPLPEALLVRLTAATLPTTPPICIQLGTRIPCNQWNCQLV